VDTQTNRSCPLIFSAAALAVALIALLYVTLSRVAYPFELEWMESMSLRTVQWISLGKSIYPAPSIEFVAFPYTPLYFYLSYGVSLVTGFGFLPLRLVSLIASLVSFYYLYQLLRSRLRMHSALFGVALYVASFGLNGYWFDIARVDALLMSLSVVGLYHFAKGARKHFVIAAVFFALAAFTKQTALIIALPLCIYSLIRYRKEGLWFSLPLGALVLIAGLIFHFATDGWFSYYTVGFMSNQIYKTGYLPHLLFYDLAWPLPILFVTACIALWLVAKKRVRMPNKELLIIAGASIAAAVYVDSHMASFKNDLMPMYLGLSILFALIIQLVSRARPLRAGYLYIAATLQVIYLLSRFVGQIPTDADRAAGERLQMRFANADNTWITSQAYNFTPDRIARYSHFLPMSDMITHDQSGKKAHFMQDLPVIFATIDTIVLDERLPFGVEHSLAMRNTQLHPIIESQFVFSDSLFFGADSSFVPRTGEPRRPKYVYVRR
jgi:4-amino-4-deoxy-L-arabinose transferase-like glycosyltransferase